MNTNSVIASGSTNGAIRRPIALSTWLRIWIVTASQNSWTPFGTPEVILARRYEREREHDGRRDQGRVDGVEVVDHPGDGDLAVFADVDVTGGEDVRRGNAGVAHDC